MQSYRSRDENDEYSYTSSAKPPTPPINDYEASLGPDKVKSVAKAMLSLNS